MNLKKLTMFAAVTLLGSLVVAPLTFAGHCQKDTDGDGVADCHDQCPASDTGATVHVGACDSGSPNSVDVHDLPGCTINDSIADCLAGLPESLRACVSAVIADAQGEGRLTAREGKKIIRCVKKNLP